MQKIVSPSSREVRDREWETEAGLGSKHQCGRAIGIQDRPEQSFRPDKAEQLQIQPSPHVHLCILFSFATSSNDP